MIDYANHRPTGLNLFAAEPAMFVLEYWKGVRQLVGAPAHRGTAVEAGVTMGLFDPKAAIKDCIAEAHQTYDRLMALSGDPRRDKYRAPIGDMVERALVELRKYGVPTGTQGVVEWRPDGLRLPIKGHYDYEWQQHGILADLKTTERMPSEIKISHARQVALYAASDNIDARLIYVTPNKLEPYGLENVFRHREALLCIAKKVERLLTLSDDPDYFLGLFAPNLDSFYWNNPTARQAAYHYFGV